jgi:hypothetical protein
MNQDKSSPAERMEKQALAASWPRVLIAEGVADALADSWVDSRQQSIREGQAAFARHPLTDRVVGGIFHARRARCLVRGLEGAESALAAQEAGLAKVEQVRGGDRSVRISRLLIVSADGSVRFFRQVGKIETRFARRLAVLVLDCDHEALGAAAFGPGHQARALLIEHKDAVIRFLSLLDRFPSSQ